MKSHLQFDYKPKVSEFLENRIDQDSRYAQITEIFEFLVSRDKKIGDPIDRPPAVLRRFVVKIPKLKDIAVYYMIEGKDGNVINVFLMEFA